MKKIVVITTRHTGCGHKSISNSLMDWFHEMPDVEAKEIDGFEELVNRFAFSVGASYGPTTRHGNLLWAISGTSL